MLFPVGQTVLQKSTFEQGTGGREGARQTCESQTCCDLPYVDLLGSQAVLGGKRGLLNSKER